VDEDQIELHTEMTRYDPPPQSSFLGPPLELVCDGDALEKQGTVMEKVTGTECSSLADQAVQNPLMKVLITLKITRSMRFVSKCTFH